MEWIKPFSIAPHTLSLDGNRRATSSDSVSESVLGSFEPLNLPTVVKKYYVRFAETKFL